jgi:hypothetical protein
MGIIWFQSTFSGRLPAKIALKIQVLFRVRILGQPEKGGIFAIQPGFRSCEIVLDKGTKLK